jgi:hypothetical protein
VKIKLSLAKTVKSFDNVLEAHEWGRYNAKTETNFRIRAVVAIDGVRDNKFDPMN